MARASKNGHVVSYKMPVDMALDLIGKHETAISEEFLDRRMTRLMLIDLSRMWDKHPYAYMYASWFGHNAQVFRLVDTETGEILEEGKYYLRKDLEAIEQRLYNGENLALFAF